MVDEKSAPKSGSVPVHPTQSGVEAIQLWNYCVRCRSSSTPKTMTLDLWHLSFAKFLDYLFNSAELGSSGDGKSGENGCVHCVFHCQDHYFASTNLVAVMKV